MNRRAYEFVRDMIRYERKKTVPSDIDRTLLEAMKSPPSEMTDADWDQIGKEGRKLAARRKKA